MAHIHTLRPIPAAAHDRPVRFRPELGSPTFVPTPQPEGFDVVYARWLAAYDERQRARRLHAPAFRHLPTAPSVEHVAQRLRSHPPAVVEIRPSRPPRAA